MQGRLHVTGQILVKNISQALVKVRSMRVPEDGRVRLSLGKVLVKNGHPLIHYWSNSEVVKLRQGSVRVLEDGRVWLSLREAGGHSVSWLWSRDADRRLVLNK